MTLEIQSEKKSWYIFLFEKNLDIFVKDLLKKEEFDYEIEGKRLFISAKVDIISFLDKLLEQNQNMLIELDLYGKKEEKKLEEDLTELAGF